MKSVEQCAMDIYGGIEGGGTQSTIIVVNGDGEILGQRKGPATNHLLVGFKECQRRIADMVRELKADIGIPTDTPFKSLGLYLSGCESESTNREFIKTLRENYPTLSNHYTVGSDSEAPIGTISRNGGVVCIAGTGSNFVLLQPDGTKVQCGGWGYLLGDQGSAWFIAHKAVKICFNQLDGFSSNIMPYNRTWQVVQDHFNTESQSDLLSHFYTNFDKTFIAALCEKLSVLARDGDKLCRHVFSIAGRDLARGISVVLRQASKEMLNSEEQIKVVCVGSVWLSWDLLKQDFIDFIANETNIEELTLVKVTKSVSLGAVYLASDSLNADIPRDYKENYSVFYTYKR